MNVEFSNACITIKFQTERLLQLRQFWLQIHVSSDNLYGPLYPPGFARSRKQGPVAVGFFSNLQQQLTWLKTSIFPMRIISHRKSLDPYLSNKCETMIYGLTYSYIKDQSFRSLHRWCENWQRHSLPVSAFDAPDGLLRCTWESPSRSSFGVM